MGWDSDHKNSSMVHLEVTESYNHKDCWKFYIWQGGLADYEVDRMRQHVYHMITPPQIVHQKHHSNIRHSELCSLRLYFELTTVHCMRAMHRSPFYIMLPLWHGVRQILSWHLHYIITLTVSWQKNNDGCTNYGDGRVAEVERWGLPGSRLYAAADCRGFTYSSARVPLCIPYTTAGCLVTRHHPQSTSHLISFYVGSQFS